VETQSFVMEIKSIFEIILFSINCLSVMFHVITIIVVRKNMELEFNRIWRTRICISIFSLLSIVFITIPFMNFLFHFSQYKALCSIFGFLYHDFSFPFSCSFTFTSSKLQSHQLVLFLIIQTEQFFFRHFFLTWFLFLFKLDFLYMKH
jgi:hypothetical protein